MIPQYFTIGKRFRLVDDSLCLYIRIKTTKEEQEETKRRMKNITKSTTKNSKRVFFRE